MIVGRAAHLFQDLLQVDESFLRGQLQLQDEAVDLIDDQNGPDVLQPGLTQHHLGLHTIHTIHTRDITSNCALAYSIYQRWGLKSHDLTRVAYFWT